MENPDGDEIEELSNDVVDNSLIYEGDEAGNEKSSVKDDEEQENGKSNGDNKEGKGDEEIQKVKDEHFSQTKPDEFSSENFKIELGGLPKYYPLSQLKKLLNQVLQLDAHRVKPGGMGRNVAYVNFKDEESRFKAMTILNGYKWQGATFTAQNADPAKDPVLLAKIDYLKVPKKEYEQLPLNDRIQKAVTPYHGMTYEDQIKEKDKVVKSVLRKYGNELASLNPDLRKFVHWHKIRRKGQICEVDDFVEAPVKVGYRNKCEFTIGKNKESEKSIVGFRVASYKEGSVEVGSVGHLSHLNDKMKEVVLLMEKYLETSSYEPFDPFSHKGIWRQLTIRTSNNNDVMIIIVIHPQEMDEEEITGIKEDVKLFFTEGDGKEGGITSIFFQQIGQKESGKEAEYEHIFGKTYIEETILGKTFRASPDAFLQVNTPACEALYEKIAEVADIDSTSIVLDVCCGVGTIGLSIAEGSYKCMGVEMVEKAVEDARINAEMNGIANAVFYNGKAEDYIENMIERSQRNNTIAIVDPPRAGLSGTVMNALRKCEYLNKLVYVSCDPQAALPNFQALGRPRSKTYKGTFFVPIRATPVDLFPDTPHFELIIVFERYDECKWERIMSGNPRPKDQEYFDRIPPLSQETEHFQKERVEKRRNKPDEGEDSRSRDDRRNRRRNFGGRRRGGDRERERDGGDRYDRGYSGGGGGAGGGGRGDWKGFGGGSGGGGGLGSSGNWKSGGELGSWQRVTRGEWGDEGGHEGGGGGGEGGWNRRGRGIMGGGGGGGSMDHGMGGGRSMDHGGMGGGRSTSHGMGGGSMGHGMGGGGGGGGSGGGGMGGPSRNNFRQEYGEGFQEGFQAGLEAMGTQYSGFGQGGGWNMAQTQGGYGGPGADEDYPSMNQKESPQDLCGWDYTGNSMSSNAGGAGASSSSSFQDLSTQPVTYPTSVTHPQGSGGGFSGGGWNQTGNWGSSNYGGGGGWGQGGGGGGGGNQYQNFEEPAPKKWKGGPLQQNPNSLSSGVNFDYSNY